MRKQGRLQVETTVEVAFHDVDLARVTWHGHYLKYLENARWALMDRLGYPLETMLAADVGWPIVDLQLRFIRATHYRDRLRVRASLVEWQSRVVINYLVTDAASDERVARAQTTQVAVDMRSGALLFDLPPAFHRSVEAALARLGGGA
jgi:acyl-CoA thioester hydrolase